MEVAMNTRRIAAAVLLFSAMAYAQAKIRIAPGALAPPPGEERSGPGLMLPGGLKAPQGMFDEFWNDPEIAKQLELTDDQRKQLEEAATAQKLALVDSGAGALKSFVKLSALLDAEPFDEAAYQKASDELAAATGQTVHSLAEMVAARRRILSAEQYAKLRVLQKAKQEAARRKKAADASCGPAGRGGRAREIPSSLETPLH
jgi:Spy/CpxP family protein refolding chaperone